MSDVTIAGFIEKAENIFFLFRSLLAPGHLQSSISWDRGYALFAAIAVFLVVTVSYAGYRLIKTIRKRQRNFKELVSALQDDGKELDYNLKPLFPEERPGIDPKSTSAIKERVAPEGVHENQDFDNYMEEITSVLDQKTPDAASYRNSLPNGNTALAVAPVSLPHKEKKIFALALNHLIIDKSQKPSIKTGKVFNLGLSDLKEEKNAVAVQERKIIPLKLADVVEESADIKHTALPGSGENSQTEDESATDQETLPDSIMAEAEAAISEFDNMEAGAKTDEEAYSQTPDQDEETVHEEESDASDSIWAEVEAAISEFDNMEAGAKTDEEAYSEPSDQVEDTVHEIKSADSDSIWAEAEAAISKFDNMAAGAEENAYTKSSGQSDEESFTEESDDSISPIPEAEESFSETDADTSSIQEEDIVKWEDTDDSDSMLAEIEESVLESNEIQIAREVNEETPSTVNVEEVEEETPLNMEPIPENGEEPEQPELETVQPMDVEISPSEESIDTDMEESFEVDPDLAEIENALDEADIAASEVDEPVMAEVEDPAFDPVDLEIDFTENSDASPSAVKKNIPEPVAESQNEPPVKDKLSPEMAKRVISRLEFFQKNVDEVFKNFMLNFLRKKDALSGKIPRKESTDAQSEIKR